MFKAYTQRDWAIFQQTFGQPIRIGKYGSGATEADKDTLYRAVANIAGDCAAIVPESMAIEFIESKNVGSGADLYEKRATYLDRQVSKAVLGQTATTDAVTGGLGSGKEHRQVQEDIERADAKALSAIINRDLIVPWMQLDHGPLAKYPRLRIGRPDERDIEQLVDSVDKLVPKGLRVGKSWMNDQLGIPDPGKDEELLTVPTTSPPPPPLPPALQSTQPARDEVDALATAAENIAQGGTDAMIDYIRGLVDSAPSLQAVQEALIKRKPDMPTAQLTRLMQVAMAMAELSGRADIADAV
jgi:phage gp29-like protein